MIYYTGNITVEVKQDFGVISYCYYHGYRVEKTELNLEQIS